jgi:hypothetical protein
MLTGCIAGVHTCAQQHMMLCTLQCTLSRNLLHLFRPEGDLSDDLVALQGNIYVYISCRMACRWVETNADWANPAGGDLVYNTTFTEGFEGWGIISRRLAPMWDVKYRGYGKDKIAWTGHLHRAGFRYYL